VLVPDAGTIAPSAFDELRQDDRDDLGATDLTGVVHGADAIEQPAGVDVGEIVIRPTAQAQDAGAGQPTTARRGRPARRLS
jgi:hypothetical protein